MNSYYPMVSDSRLSAIGHNEQGRQGKFPPFLPPEGESGKNLQGGGLLGET